MTEKQSRKMLGNKTRSNSEVSKRQRNTEKSVIAQNENNNLTGLAEKSQANKEEKKEHSFQTLKLLHLDHTREQRQNVNH